MSRLQLILGCCLLIVTAGCGAKEEASQAAQEAEAEVADAVAAIAEAEFAEDAAEATTEETAEATTEDAAAKTVHPENPNNLNSGMLRHAVFFSFKESSSEADIQGVVDAFAALPSKIDSIIDFQYGVNNSPEGLDDGFTHCFLLTFADDAGRQAYLPHEAHKAFGDVLRPHMKSVFVIDYWGDAKQTKPEKALQHAVFFKFKDDASREGVQQVEEAFAALPAKIDTIAAFEWGVNNSPEKHDAGFTHCFLVTFDSEEGRETYLPHPDHKAFVSVLEPVLDKVRVLDFWAETP